MIMVSIANVNSSKKKAMIRVEDGEWSDKFSIDVAGSKGVVSCKYNGQTYQVILPKISFCCILWHNLYFKILICYTCFFKTSFRLVFTIN